MISLHLSHKFSEFSDESDIKDLYGDFVNIGGLFDESIALPVVVRVEVVSGVERCNSEPDC